MTGQTQILNLDLPSWVPIAAENYLQHTVMGHSIRAVARSKRCHPSTILRQVRRFEAKRDDPLVDGALSSFGLSSISHIQTAQKEIADMSLTLLDDRAQDLATLSPSKINQEGLVVLRRLCERGSVLAVARDMDSAVVVREDCSGQSLRRAVVERCVAQAMALRNWINCDDPDARIARYFITKEGRRSMRELTAQEENRAQAFDETAGDEDWSATPSRSAKSRYIVAENPIMALSRRKDKTGKPFISSDQLAAGERLRQDYEISDIAHRDFTACKAVLAQQDVGLSKGVVAARNRLRAALNELGPGLSEVALECCCFINGLEVTEKKMGWSSRSGKIVLRIALTRLTQHYQEATGKYAPLIE